MTTRGRPHPLTIVAIVALTVSCVGGAQDTPAPAPSSTVPAYAKRGDAVEARNRTYRDRLQRYYERLCDRVRADAPDLYPKLEKVPPKPAVYGYQLLPRIVADPPPPAHRPRAVSRWYTWPWTEQKIDTEMKKLEGFDGELERLATVPAVERRTGYEKLVAEYPRLLGAQENIDAHVQYNRLWQPDVARRKWLYDSGTHLHDVVLERQAILDVLDAKDAAAFVTALDAVPEVDRTQVRSRIDETLRARETALANEIHAAIDQITPPSYLQVEERTPHLWVVRAPLYTDIDDRDFVESARRGIESVWHVRDGDDEFAVELAVTYISPQELYRKRAGCQSGTASACTPPRRGDHIDLAAHAGLFPADGAKLTTGAGTTHAIAGAIALGSTEVGAHLLAHEFGHMLGFRDEYFRGYRDLGPDGFQVMEVDAEPDDIMGNPGSGPVFRYHFERLLAAVSPTLRPR